MALVSLEGQPNFQGDALSENPDSQFDGVVTQPRYRPLSALEKDPDFIGPHDATNEARPLLEIQARNLAQVAVMNFPAYNHELLKVMAATKSSVSAGLLRLGADFKADTVDKQVEMFVTATTMNVYQPHDEVAAELKADKERLRASMDGPDRALQLELNATRELVGAQAKRILAVRNMLIDRDASVEFLRDFDYTTKLMSQPDIEAYEQERSLTSEVEISPLVTTGEVRTYDKFMEVLAETFSIDALRRRVSIRAPQSAKVAVVVQPQGIER